MNCVVREFQASDLPALRELFLVSRRATFTWEMPDWFRIDDLDRSIEGESILVAVEEETPVGFVSWWPPEDFVHNLFVRPDRVGKGIGTALLNACLKQIGRPARLKCITKNRAATEFYLQHGWVIESEGSGADGDYLAMVFE